ncbi:MAG: hypothetical protein LUF90_02525 [Rikenellaceae bacterium]|nr:hypothetical protein [Rikenellaceae bacterium]
MKKLLFALIAITGLVLTGCSKDENGENGNTNGKGAITVRIEGSSKSRSLENLSAVDSKIFNYHVYVFGATTGILEAQATGNATNPTTITELSSASTKKVVILANLGVYPDVNNYSELSAAVNKINLDKQSPDAVKENGYIMTGISKNEVTVIKDNTVEERVYIERAVAKISLESITFEPEDGHDINLLEILGVSVQRVAPEVTLSPLKSYYTVGQQGSYHYGGIAAGSSELQVKSYLYDDLNIGTIPYDTDSEYELGNYFLVFPNTSAENCTLLTISAKYDDDQIYYPIKINYQDGNENTDGTFVNNNKHYKVSVTIKKLGEGTTDPEQPREEGSLDVIVEVIDWEYINQNETW